MDKITIKKYYPSDSLIKQLIKFYWVINGDFPAFDHKMLPLKNIDLIINLSDGGETSSWNNQFNSTSCITFTGLQDKFNFKWKKNSGRTFVIGITFFPYGLYPFLKIPVSEFKNHLIDFSLLKENFCDSILNELNTAKSVNENLKLIENQLLKIIQIDLLNNAYFFKLFKRFSNSNNQIDQFCRDSGVNRRTFERDFNKYIGLSPKSYKKISRFRAMINDTIFGNYKSFSELAYRNGYFDQMHLIRDFKNYTGESPSNFVKEKKSFKQISTLI